MRMTMKEKKILTKALCEQYRKASKKQKGILLTQFVKATKYTRSYASYLLRNHGRCVYLQHGVVLVS